MKHYKSVMFLSIRVLFFNLVTEQYLPLFPTITSMRLWGDTRICCLSVKRHHIHCLNCWTWS